MRFDEWCAGQLRDTAGRWLEACPALGGLFLPQMDRRWQPRSRSRATLVSQSRLLYVFARGAAHGGGRRFVRAVESGAEALLSQFATPAGGWASSVAPDGAQIDTTFSAYGNAFSVFGLAHAYHATGDTRYREAALVTREWMRTHMRDRDGGLIPHLDAELRDTGQIRSQNPVMHWFEALLALGTLGGAPDALGDARSLAEFVLTRLVRPLPGSLPRVLPEFFSADWAALPAERGGRIDVGHQFEWAYLLARASELGLGSDLADAGSDLLSAGLALGGGAPDGAVRSPALPDGTLVDGPPGWWQQCEASRALAHYAALRSRSDLWPRLGALTQFCIARFIDREYGGWFMTPWPDCGEAGADKGTEWKVDYHVVGMCDEGIRLVQAGPDDAAPPGPAA